jgi:hypothetical protein
MNSIENDTKPKYFTYTSLTKWAKIGIENTWSKIIANPKYSPYFTILNSTRTWTRFHTGLTREQLQEIYKENKENNKKSRKKIKK